MVMPRTSALSAVLRNQPARTARSAVRTRVWHQVQKRGYASEDGHGGQKSSDLPWLIGAIAVTVPSCAYLLQSGPEKGHGHEEHAKHEKHDEKEEKAEDGEGTGEEEKGDEGKEENGDEGKEESDDKDKDSESEGSEQDTPDTSDDDEPKEAEGKPESKDKGSAEGVQSKGAAKSDDDDKKAQGEPEDKDTKPNPAKKPADSKGQQSNKQEGLSNADTKHSTDVAGSGKSTTASGKPETAKQKGTVDQSEPTK